MHLSLTAHEVALELGTCVDHDIFLHLVTLD